MLMCEIEILILHPPSGIPIDKDARPSGWLLARVDLAFPSEVEILSGHPTNLI